MPCHYDAAIAYADAADCQFSPPLSPRFDMPLRFRHFHYADVLLMPRAMPHLLLPLPRLLPPCHAVLLRC